MRLIEWRTFEKCATLLSYKYIMSLSKYRSKSQSRTLPIMPYIILLIVLAIAGIALFFYITSRKTWEKHEAFAEKWSLSLGGNPISPVLWGKHKGWDVNIAILPEENGKKQRKNLFSQVSIKMENPNGMVLHVYKQGLPPLPPSFMAKRGDLVLKNNFEPPLEGRANDLFFPGMILDEEMKKEIVGVLLPHSSAMLALQEDYFCIVSPVLPYQKEVYEVWEQQLQVLSEIKKRLQN